MENQSLRKINKKKIIFILCVLAIIVLGMSLRSTFSRYQSKATSKADVDVAFWLVTDTIQTQNVVLEDIEPDTTQECLFSVSNNNGTIRSNTAIEYTITMTATTNLPLTYAIYQKTESGETECEIDSERLFKDDDGTYYKELIVSGLELGCDEDETTQFALKATFPKANNDSKLADLVECVNLKLEAQQKINE